MKTQFIVGSPESKKISRMFRIYHIPLLTLLMRYNSETDRNKSAQYKVRSRYNKCLLLITEKLQKILPISQVRALVSICLKYATPLPPALG